MAPGKPPRKPRLPSLTEDEVTSLLEQFDEHRAHLICPNCLTAGRINRTGNNKADPPCQPSHWRKVEMLVEF